MDCREKIVSEDYADFLIGIDNEFRGVQDMYAEQCVQFLSVNYAVIYNELAPFDKNTRASEIGTVEGKKLLSYGYTEIPKLYNLMDTAALEETGAIRLQNFKGLELKGNNVIIGFITDGIDVYHSAFRFSNGDTRIIGAWDQTNQNLSAPYNLIYGSYLTREMINRELREENSPILESLVRDSEHGTFEAGIAAGNSSLENGFSSAAPNADIAVVKLKPAKKYLRKYYYADDDAKLYQENDIMTAISFLTQLAMEFQKPLIICQVTGTSFGSHNGFSLVGDLLNCVGQRAGIGVCVACGNEGNARHHYSGTIQTQGMYEDVELRVEEQLEGISMELWGESPDLFSLEIISPTGERIPKIAIGIQGYNEFEFLFQNSRIAVKYEIVEKQSGGEVIELKIHNPAAGVWTFRIYGDIILNGQFNIWLPTTEILSENTYFLRPDPFTTLTIPSDAKIPLAVAAYNNDTDGIYIDSGRGFITSFDAKPTLAAPGVNIISTAGNNSYSEVSGTSVATAITAGIMAQFMEWGVNRGIDTNMNTTEIKSYLIRGADRRNTITYPDREWGYGEINAFRSLDILKN